MKNQTPITVAYAEDHTAVRKSIISYMHSLGGVEVIIEASNGKELIEKIDQAPVKPDLCMTDIRMPLMNGFEAIAIIKQKWQNIKTLVLTAFAEEMYVVRMIRAGVNGYLCKDCDPEEIKQALISIYKTGIYYSELFARKIALALHNNEISMPDFTAREQDFLKHCCSDLTYIQIAHLMKGTPKSIEGYRDSLFKKLKINSRVILALFAVKTGTVPLESGPLG